MKRKINFIGMIISVVATVLSVYSMAGRVRTVDIITLFFSGALAGITTLNIIKFKKSPDDK